MLKGRVINQIWFHLFLFDLSVLSLYSCNFTVCTNDPCLWPLSTKAHKHTEPLRHHHLKKKTEIKREKGQHILSTSKSWRLYHTSLSWCKETVGDVQWLDAKGPKIKDDIQLHWQLADHNNKTDNGADAFEAYILTWKRGQQKPQP